MSDSPFTRPVIRPDADILARVPGLCLGCLVHEVEVEPSRPDCQDYLDNEMAPRLVARMEDKPLAQWPNLGPSRAGCKACGKDPGRYRISSEALYRRLKQGKGLYAINSVVDANNIASLETGFSLGSYTLGNLRGDITFRRGLPGETYERTHVCLTIIYGFDGAAPVEEALRISAAAFARFCRCRPLCDPWCVQG